MSNPPTICGGISGCVDYSISGSSSTAVKCVYVPNPGTYYLVIKEWSWPPGPTYTLKVEYSGSSLPPDFTFTAPFTHSDSTCGKGNDILQHVCPTTNSLGGEDVLYAIDFPTIGTYQISLTSTSGNVSPGWFLMTSTPTACDGILSCFEKVVTIGSNSAVKCVNITIPGRYYLAIDNGSLSCFKYTLNVDYAVPLPADFTFTAPFTHSDSTCGKGNDILTNTCSSSYAGGEDVIYAIDFPTAGTYQISLTNTSGSGYIGWFLMSNQPTMCSGVSACVDYATSGSSNSVVKTVNIATAGTYYLVIDYWPAPYCSQYSINVSIITGYYRNDIISQPVNVYPNPFNDKISIEFPKAEVRKVEVEVMSVEGKTILVRHFSDIRSKLIVLDAEGIPSGTYILNIKAEEIHGSVHYTRHLITKIE